MRLLRLRDKIGRCDFFKRLLEVFAVFGIEHLRVDSAVVIESLLLVARLQLCLHYFVDLGMQAELGGGGAEQSPKTIFVNLLIL